MEAAGVGPPPSVLCIAAKHELDVMFSTAACDDCVMLATIGTDSLQRLQQLGIAGLQLRGA
jgi:hypothetical protein